MSEIVFNLNGQRQVVTSQLPPYTSLNDYIRNHANLRGTKAMCHEGGCGACVVSVKAPNIHSTADKIFSVNSCLVSVFSCHGWNVTTIEGIGNRRDGYHVIQSRLAGFNGTQCGFCSPGWVMNMYSAYEGSNRQMSMKEVENSFAGNMCRCTGYRPILDAFKSLASDADPKLRSKINDIEDMSGINMCASTGTCFIKCPKNQDIDSEFCVLGIDAFADDTKVIKMDLDGVLWYKAYTVEQVFEIFRKEGTSSYSLVAGNTAQGVYHIKEYPKLMIDISSVEELKKSSLLTDLILGGGITLAEVMDIFKSTANINDYFRYLKQLYNHLDLVAHVPVRNIGTLAGNLSIKHQHNEFQSDIFLLLETIGAVITIADMKGRQEMMSLSNFLKTDMIGKIIIQACLPPLDEDNALKTYKITPRAQNAHAQVHAGFLLKFNKERSAVMTARIVFGGIDPKFIHASATENFLIGKDIFNNDILQNALIILGEELIPEFSPPDPSPQFRRKLALGLFYKYILRICPKDRVDPRLVSGGTNFKRAISSGQQKYDTKKSLWPLNKPIPKIEALVQCAGEAQYTNDMPTIPGELFATFVLSKVHRGTIDKIEPSEALNLKGVIAFYSAKDIPGLNTFTPPIIPQLPDLEEVLCSKSVKYHGQPVGIIVASTEKLANKAATMVKVFYKDVPSNPPVLTIEAARNAPESEKRVVNVVTKEATKKGSDVKQVIKGRYTMPGQYHFTMELQTCVCIPTENGLDVFSSTQYVNLVHIAISYMLGIPQNQINLTVRRLGGAYGSKISRPGQIACACALAAKLLNRPVRFILSLETNMSMIGGRLPLLAEYEVGVDDNGVIQYLNNYFYNDNGSSHNDAVGLVSTESFPNCYNSESWLISANSVFTDTASNTWTRAPGTTEGIAMIEHIMEHISTVTRIDPVAIRIANMPTTDNPMASLISFAQQTSDYNKRLRDIKDFNNANRWKKRGIHLVPMSFPLVYFGNLSAFIAVYQADGTVSVTHAGIEMGQGLNTKVAQVVAHTLQIPLEMVSIKPTTNLTSPNAIVTGGSMTSESCCYAAMKACQDLLGRMEPIKKTMKNPTWQQLVLQCYISGVDLTAKHMFVGAIDGVQPYPIWGVTICEVELDVLTGQPQVLRVDILEDVGESLSPEVDVGQIEGAFIMGLGYWTSEKLEYDRTTGELLTKRTWTYKPPGVKDIPMDFRVQFRRKSPNPVGVLRSKATGEPSLCMAVTVTHAIRKAISAARKDAGHLISEWCDIDPPYTNETILNAINSNITDYKLK